MKRNTLSAIKIATATLGAAALMLGLSSCSSAGQEPVQLSEDAIVLDVRTPEEFAGGHLEGAQLLDFNSGEFAAALPSLDPEAEYVIYCRSGNRAGQAMALMQRDGIENVTNLGSLEQAAQATGIAVVVE
ncbi:MAG: rhodanese-like domain-containing protein [Actinobacteria bacterium]|jgi:rhodanese-related sulfurtransferase|nr:rhodanese-like domain-containing protein [Actinomycetota bacterium]